MIVFECSINFIVFYKLIMLKTYMDFFEEFHKYHFKLY